MWGGNLGRRGVMRVSWGSSAALVAVAEHELGAPVVLASVPRTKNLQNVEKIAKCWRILKEILRFRAEMDDFFNFDASSAVIDDFVFFFKRGDLGVLGVWAA